MDTQRKKTNYSYTLMPENLVVNHELERGRGSHSEKILHLFTEKIHTFLSFIPYSSQVKTNRLKIKNQYLHAKGSTCLYILSLLTTIPFFCIKLVKAKAGMCGVLILFSASSRHWQKCYSY